LETILLSFKLHLKLIFFLNNRKYDYGESSSSSSKYGSRYAKDLEEIEEEERKLEELESLIAKRLSKGVGKYEGKF
jgi:hypothetical protein